MERSTWSIETLGLGNDDNVTTSGIYEIICSVRCGNAKSRCCHSNMTCGKACRLRGPKNVELD